jgi:hypothetical protein
MRAITYVAWGLALAWAGESLATPLDKAVCDNLKEEHGQLVLAGAKANMERGPDWAKVNLAPDRIKQIERLIDVEEMLAFRCPQPKPPVERAENQEAAEAAEAADAPSASDQPKAQPKAASPRKVIPAKRKAKTRSAGGDATRTGGRRSKKTTSRPKANDAYVAPPKETSAVPSRPPAQ